MPSANRNKQWLLPLICFAVVAAILAASLLRTRTPQPTGAPGDAVPVVEWPSTEVRQETLKDNGKTYQITAAYPVTHSTTITDYFYSFVSDEIDSFKQNMESSGEPPEGFPPATMDISYEERKNETADNYVFAIYTDTGGAHGFEATKTFSFDKSGKPITLEDLFTDDEQGLAAVAEYVMPVLSKSELTDANWVQDGAGPTAENYRNFTVESTGVTFIFEPYQVAAYAAGTQTVSVPVTAFQKWVNKEVFK